MKSVDRIKSTRRYPDECKQFIPIRLNSSYFCAICVCSRPSNQNGSRSNSATFRAAGVDRIQALAFLYSTVSVTTLLVILPD